MSELDPQVSVRIRNAAANCQRLRTQLEAIRDPNDPRLRELKDQYDKAEQDMIQASMSINRGISRPAPT